MGKRVDNILLLNGIIYLLEFKIFAKSYESYAIDQVVDYALDLKNFHSGSHNKTIVPILVSTMAKEAQNEVLFAEDKVSICLKTNANKLGKLIKNIDIKYRKEPLDVQELVKFFVINQHQQLLKQPKHYMQIILLKIYLDMVQRQLILHLPRILLKKLLKIVRIINKNQFV